MGRSVLVIAACLAAGLLSSCSNTRVLSEKEYRLETNKVQFLGDPAGLSTSDVSSYIRQQTNNSFFLGWVYNWSNPRKDDWLNNSLRKVGTAPVVFNGNLLGSSRENIERHLDYLGYYHSKVQTWVDTIGKNIKVTYYVTPGKRVRIDSLVYKVPEGEFADEFAKDFKNIQVKKGDWLSEKALEKESERGAAYFRNQGYYDVTKFNYFFSADTLGPRNVLTYEIRDYSRNESESNAAPLVKYHIGKVEISHPSIVPFREKVLKDINIIKPGDLYSEKLANVNYYRFSALRLFSNVSVEMTPADSSTVDCKITLGQSKLKGLKLNLEASTNSNSLFGISPAVSFYNKNIFRGGEWLSLGFSGNFQRKFGTDLQSNEFGITGSLSFPKFVGLPYSVFKGPNIPRTEVQLSVNYQNRPEFRRLISSASYGYTGNDDNFYYQVYPLRATVIKVWDMSDKFVENLMSNLMLWDSFTDHIDAGLGAQLYWTTDASVIPKGSYRYIRLNFDSSGNVISLFNPWLPGDEVGNKALFGLSYSQYVRAALDMGWTVSFSPSTSLASRLYLGTGKGYGKSSASVPFEKQFSVGGASSMRGWQVRTLGPGHNCYETGFFSFPSQVGDSKFEFDLELRQKLFWKLDGALFAEAGNIWDLWLPDEYQLVYDSDGQITDIIESYNLSFKEKVIDTIAIDWGLGLRLNLGFILLRLDLGMKVRDPSRSLVREDWMSDEYQVYSSYWLKPSEWLGKNGCSLHFGVGYPF